MHQTLINTWKRQALEGMFGLFSGKTEAKAAEKEGDIEKLHSKTGQLVEARDFFSQDLRTVSVSPRREMIEPRHLDPMIAGSNAVHIGAATVCQMEPVCVSGLQHRQSRPM